MSETQLFFIFWTDTRNQISNSRLIRGKYHERVSFIVTECNYLSI